MTNVHFRSFRSMLFADPLRTLQDRMLCQYFLSREPITTHVLLIFRYQVASLLVNLKENTPLIMNYGQKYIF